MKRRLLNMAVTLLLTVVLAACSDGEKGNGVVAEFGDFQVTAEMVENNRELDIRNAEVQPGYKIRSEEEIIEDMLKGQMLYLEALEKGYAATQEQIDSLVEGVYTSYELPDGKKLIDGYLAESGLSYDEYVSKVRELAPYMLAKLNFSDAIMREYCEEHGIEYTGANMPREVTESVGKYKDELYELHKSEVKFY